MEHLHYEILEVCSTKPIYSYDCFFNNESALQNVFIVSFAKMSKMKIVLVKNG